MRLKSPCKNCQDRSIEPVNCHTNCEKYLEYQVKNAELRNQEYDFDKVDRQILAIRKQWRNYSQMDPRPESLKHGRQVRRDKKN